MQGVIKKKLADKNFGFIQQQDSEKDVFFHASAVTGGSTFETLREGDEVTFEVENTPKGAAAINVQKA